MPFKLECLLHGWILVLILMINCGCERKQSAVIAGASMAPTLVGEHLQSICGDCQFPFKSDGDRIPKSGKLVCPNCGFRENTVAQAGRRMSEIVDVVPVRYPGEIKRWDIVAIRDPNDGRVLVKRVVGLPGETIELRDGNVWVDGSLPDREMKIRNQMLVGVFDSRYLPRFDAGNTPRIAGRLVAQQPSGWQRESRQFVYRGGRAFADASGRNEIDWLDYHHWRCYMHRGPRDQGFSIDDSLGFNQTLSRDVHGVNELIMEAELKFTLSNRNDNRFLISVPFLGAGTICEFDLDRGCVALSKNLDDRRWVGKCPSLLSEGASVFDAVITLANLDGCVSIAVDNRVVSLVNEDEVAVDPSDLSEKTKMRNVELRKGATTSGAVPFSLGVPRGSQPEVTLKRFRIWRDLYYFAGANLGSVKLGKDEFFVLGDNPALSRDSRDPEIGSVKRSEVIGRVKQP